MMYYEIYQHGTTYEVWKWTNNGANAERIKSFKSKKAAESWAAKQWVEVIWR